MTSKYLIYGLSDPETLVMRYVGKSSCGLTRPNAHCSPGSLKRDKSYKANWIRECLVRNKKPVITILEELNSAEDLNTREKYWIAQYSTLTNLTIGGDGFTSGSTSLVKAVKNRCASRVWRNGHAKRRRPILACNLKTQELRFYLSAYHAAEDLNGRQGMIHNVASKRVFKRYYGGQYHTTTWTSYRGWDFKFISKDRVTYNFTNS